MTASHPPRSESRIHLDSTAQLMDSISSRLAGRLRLVSPLGHRRTAPPALVLVAHGSRDPRALETVRTLADRVRELRPVLAVHLGHIELNEPLLPDTLAALGDTPAVLVPLLLSRGYHVKQDIPEMAAAAPAPTRLAAPLGPHPLLVETLYDRLVDRVIERLRAHGPGGDPVFGPPLGNCLSRT
ncbi:sirohydrochlorin chelatase, partial [Streptomyces sp. NPDC003233]